MTLMRFELGYFGKDFCMLQLLIWSLLCDSFVSCVKKEQKAASVTRLAFIGHEKGRSISLFEKYISIRRKRAFLAS